jgi:signal transduction histidine kinase
MKASRSLKQRVARSFMLLAVVIAGSFTLFAGIMVEAVEAQLVDTQMERLIETMIEQRRHDQLTEMEADMKFFVGDAIPRTLRDAPPGTHEVMLNGEKAQALVVVSGGERFALVREMSDFERTELVIFTALGTGFLTSLLLAGGLGWLTARQVTAPVIALTDAVSRNAPPDALPSVHAEDEIGILARAFAKRTEELQNFLMRERLFTGDVSHELRTPLTIILGAAELLKAQLADHPQQLAVAERLRRVASEASVRVSALLLLSRSPQHLDAPCIPLHLLVQSELERWQPLLQGKPVQCRFEPAPPVWVHVHPELAGIVVGNLLRNACQHIDSGMITIRLAADSLTIEDDGPGLPPAVRERLFGRFVQSNSNATEGTGLGLSIVKRFSEQIGWDIDYQAPPTGGSRFILRFSKGTDHPA